MTTATLVATPDQPAVADYRGIPTAACPCGSRVLTIHVWFDDEYILAGYMTDGECTECGALLTIATEIDHPLYREG